MTEERGADGLSEAKRLLSEGDPSRALAQLRALKPYRDNSTDERLFELALLAIEHDAIAFAAEAMTQTANATHKTGVLVSELLALQPKIPTAYLRLFAEGTRTGLTHALRGQIDALKQQNLSDAAEVFGQLGLRAPRLRQTYGTLMDPLLNGDGTPRKAPWHWGWLAAGLAALTSLFLSLAKLNSTIPPAPAPSIDIEFADGSDAMMSSAVSLICSDRPERCDDARMLLQSLDRHECSGVEARIQRLIVGDLDDTSGDAIRLLQQRIEQACEVTATDHHD